jgi:fucose permease
VALAGGGAVGPWVAGVIHDETGSYELAFLLTIACCVVSAAAIWIAAPRKVRRVPGRAHKPPAEVRIGQDHNPT